MVGIIASLVVSYARARAEGLGLDCKVGIAQRAERILLLGIPPLLFGAGPGSIYLQVIVVLLTVWRSSPLSSASCTCTARPTRRIWQGCRTGSSPAARHTSGKEVRVADKGARPIAKAEGKLGVLTVGLGAVAIDVHRRRRELARKGIAQAVSARSPSWRTIRLGKRTDGRTPLIKDFVPLASLDDLVFGAWDPIPDNAYEAALKCGVLDKHEHVEPIAGLPQGHQADAGGVRPQLREAARGHQRQGRQDASGSRPRRSGRTSASSRRRTTAAGW